MKKVKLIEVRSELGAGNGWTHSFQGQNDAEDEHDPFKKASGSLYIIVATVKKS